MFSPDLNNFVFSTLFVFPLCCRPSKTIKTPRWSVAVLVMENLPERVCGMAFFYSEREKIASKTIDWRILDIGYGIYVFNRDFAGNRAGFWRFFRLLIFFLRQRGVENDRFLLGFLFGADFFPIAPHCGKKK
jgi:hypothetical protein